MNHQGFIRATRAKYLDEAAASLARVKAALPKLPEAAPAAYHTSLAELLERCEMRTSKALETRFAFEAKFQAAMAEEFAKQAEAKVAKAIHLYGQKAD